MRVRTPIQKRIVVRETKIVGILSYDSDNKYPQKIRDIIRDSGRGSLCVDMYGRFLKGKGFTVDALNKVIVNRWGVNGLNLLREAAGSYSLFRGFAIHVNYNTLFEIKELTAIPFEQCRLVTPDDTDYVGGIAVYNNWAGEKYKSITPAKAVRYHKFNPLPEVIMAQVEKAGGWTNYKGQVFYFSADGPNMYPLCSLDAVLEDCVTDGKIKAFKYNRITTDFMASHMLVTKGKMEGGEEKRAFDRNIESFQGAENANKIFHVEIDQDEDKPEVIPFEHTNNDRIFQYTEASVHENIRKRLFIPPVLVGDLIAGKLGTSEEIYDAYALYNSVTEIDRLEIEEKLAPLFQLWVNDLGEEVKIEPRSIDVTQREILAKPKPEPEE